jgi:RNA polymerase sigma-70 factor, ECF subfamily
MVEDRSSEALIQQAGSGDRVAFGQLVERYRERLRNLVVARLGSALRGDVEAQDIIQETFLKGLENIARFDWRGEDSFLPWLGTIAENIIRKKARSRARRPVSELTLDLPASGTNPSRRLRREDRFERLQRALDTLPEDYREVVRLSRIEGLKIDEMAERMGRSTAAVKQLLFRALRRLRESFGDTESLHLPDRRFDWESE